MASAEGAYEIGVPGGDVTFEANAAISAHRFVTLKTASNRVSMAGDNEDITGVAMEAQATVGEPLRVRTLGIGMIECGDTITIGARVKSDASGKAVAIVETAGSASQEVGGRLIHTGASGDLQPLLIQPGQFQDE